MKTEWSAGDPHAIEAMRRIWLSHAWSMLPLKRYQRLATALARERQRRQRPIYETVTTTMPSRIA